MEKKETTPKSKTLSTSESKAFQSKVKVEKKIAKPGKVVTHHALLKYVLPKFNIKPQVAAFGSPRPKKLIVDSHRM